jgi:phage baseplate assembly protein W
VSGEPGIGSFAIGQSAIGFVVGAISGTLSAQGQNQRVSGQATAAAATGSGSTGTAGGGVTVSVSSGSNANPQQKNGGQMSDISHVFGYDLQIDATGDIAVSGGTAHGQERVIRRLLTNPNGYIWNPTYGAGLSRFLGRPATPTRMAAISRAQMALERAVSMTPAPRVQVVAQPDGTVIEIVRYVDAETGEPASLTLPVGT